MGTRMRWTCAGMDTAGLVRGTAGGRRATTGRGGSKEWCAGAVASSGNDGLGVQVISLPTVSARREIVLEKHKEWHYVSAVATGSEAEKKGVVPGMVLRSVSHPVEKGNMWRVRETDGNDKTISSASLRNVRDAISSTRQYDIVLEFETSIEVTADMVTAEKDDETEEKSGAPGVVPARPTIAEQLQAQQQQQITKAPASERVDRPDLYVPQKYRGT